MLCSLARVSRRDQWFRNKAPSHPATVVTQRVKTHGPFSCHRELPAVSSTPQTGSGGSEIPLKNRGPVMAGVRNATTSATRTTHSVNDALSIGWSESNLHSGSYQTHVGTHETVGRPMTNETPSGANRSRAETRTSVH